MDEHNELRTRLRAVGMELFRRDGLRFTMQQAAAMMHISKKTIYAVYPSKEALLLDMVDDAFTRIHARKQRILDGPGTLAEKLRAVIIALPEEYTALDLQQMDLLDEKYPRVAARVREHLETGWEPTLALLEQAMGEGVIRRVSLPVLQRMISASIEDFLQTARSMRKAYPTRMPWMQMHFHLLGGVVGTMRYSLCNHWEFTEQWSDAFCRGEPVGCRPVRLPHTCRELPLHYADPSDYEMVCGYRRTLTVPDAPRVFLRFDGAAHQAEIYLNGQLAGQHQGGYTGFTIEITDLVHRGTENLLAVRLDTREDPSLPPSALSSTT